MGGGGGLLKAFFGNGRGKVVTHGPVKKSRWPFSVGKKKTTKLYYAQRKEQQTLAQQSHVVKSTYVNTLQKRHLVHNTYVTTVGTQ